MNHYKKILFITGAAVSFLFVCGCAAISKQEKPQREMAATTPVPNVITLEYRQ
jgi:hypothetical protein